MPRKHLRAVTGPFGEGRTAPRILAGAFVQGANLEDFRPIGRWPVGGFSSGDITSVVPTVGVGRMPVAGRCLTDFTFLR